jgi:hypothetical protein
VRRRPSPQTAYVGTRILAGTRSGVRAAVIAKDTVVSTADKPASSASIHTPNALTNCRMIALGTWCTRSSSRTMIQAAGGTDNKAADNCEQETQERQIRSRSCPQPRNPTASRKISSAVASLKRLSPREW